MDFQTTKLVQELLELRIQGEQVELFQQLKSKLSKNII